MIVKRLAPRRWKCLWYHQLSTMTLNFWFFICSKSWHWRHLALSNLLFYSNQDKWIRKRIQNIFYTPSMKNMRGGRIIMVAHTLIINIYLYIIRYFKLACCYHDTNLIFWYKHISDGFKYCVRLQLSLNSLIVSNYEKIIKKINKILVHTKHRMYGDCGKHG